LADFLISEESSEPEHSSEVVETSEANGSPEAAPESNETQDNSETPTSPRRTFKYKSSHPEELIIGNVNSPRKTRSAFRQDESLLGLISMIETTFEDETLSDDGWIVAMQVELNQF
jgi:hypothetical protein